MLDDSVGHLAHLPAMALMTRLGPAGLGLLAPLLAIRGRRLGGGVRGLLRPLQPQHQLDQLLLAQALKLAPAHLTRESAKPAPRKEREVRRCEEVAVRRCEEVAVRRCEEVAVRRCEGPRRTPGHGQPHPVGNCRLWTNWR